MATPEEMADKMIASIPEKTGKTLPQWRKLVTSAQKKGSLEKHGQIVKHLKTDHGVGHGYANLIAQAVLGNLPRANDRADLVAAQYEGAKEGLRPIYERIVEAVQDFGEDVEISPKKTSVSLRRKKQFGLITPATRTRVDVGVQLKGEAPQGRLEACKGSTMTSHQVRVETTADVDRELIGWLRRAYDRAG